MTNSDLVNVTMLSPNHSGKRTHSIDRITPHVFVGQVTAERIGNEFLSTTRKASCNYGIAADGRVTLCVSEAYRSWCSDSRDNDQRAVTIECASASKAPYELKDVVYQKLITLCEDICRRNGKKKLLWINDKAKALAYNPAEDEMLLTVHRWFANKSCPGDWIFARLGAIAEEVTRRLSDGNAEVPNAPTQTAKPTTGQSETLYRVQVGAFKIKANADNMLARLKKDGYDGFIVEVKK